MSNFDEKHFHKILENFDIRGENIANIFLSTRWALRIMTHIRQLFACKTLLGSA